MKKSLILLASALAVLALASCDNPTGSSAMLSNPATSSKAVTSSAANSSAAVSSAAASSATTSSTAASSTAAESSYVPESYDPSGTFDITLLIKCTDYQYDSTKPNFLYLRGSWNPDTPGALTTADGEGYYEDMTGDIAGGAYSFELYTLNLSTQVKSTIWTIHFTANATKTLKYSGNIAAGFALVA
jgi:uncharacterized lipoprotein NlpE involved in copper resistance